MDVLERNALARDVCQKLTGKRVPPPGASLLLWSAGALANRASFPAPLTKEAARLFFDTHQKSIEKFVQDTKPLPVDKRNELCKDVCQTLTGKRIAPGGGSMLQYVAEHFAKEWSMKVPSDKTSSRRFIDRHHGDIELWLRNHPLLEETK